MSGPSFFARQEAPGRVATHGTPTFSAGYGDVFASWHWDGAALRIRTDRFGCQPLFYCAREGEIGVSTSLTTLVEQMGETELDAGALAVFLRLGFFLGDDTPFLRVRAAPPGADLRWQPDSGLEGGGSMRWPEAGSLGHEEAEDGFIELFRAAMARHEPNGARVGVPLSGGRDSRHILLELCRQGRPPELAVTVRKYPPHQQREFGAAAAIAARLGVPHVLAEQSLPLLQAEKLKNEVTSYCSDEHAWCLEIPRALSGRAELAYDGIAGDVLSAGLFLTERRLALFRAGAWPELAGELFVRDEELLERLLAPDLYREASLERALERLLPELERHREAANPVGSFYFWNRTRREIALSPYAILSDAVGVLSPFLDEPLVDHLASLPAELLVDHGFHTRALQRAYPDYADVPFEDEHPFDHSRAHFRRIALDYCRVDLHAKPSRFIRRSYASLQSARNVVSGGSNRWYPLAIYLLGLHELTSGEQRQAA